MGIASLFKKTIKSSADDITKGVKSLTRGSVKTTAKLGVKEASIKSANAVAKTSSSNLKLGKKIFGTGAAGLAVGAGGLYEYNAFKNIAARDDSFYQNQDYLKQLQDLSSLQAKGVDISGSPTSPSSVLITPQENASQNAEATEQKSDNMKWILGTIVVVALLGSGSYAYSKSKGKK